MPSTDEIIIGGGRTMFEGVVVGDSNQQHYFAVRQLPVATSREALTGEPPEGDVRAALLGRFMVGETLAAVVRINPNRPRRSQAGLDVLSAMARGIGMRVATGTFVDGARGRHVRLEALTRFGQDPDTRIYIPHYNDETGQEVVAAGADVYVAADPDRVPGAIRLSS